MERSLREVARGIVERLQAAGHAAFWVGGCVRDMLLGLEPEDYDVATSARPEEVEALFPRTVAVGRAFGVVRVIEGPHVVEVATFRAEADYQDGRRPGRVTFADARADALRRDFTVNGLFFDPVRGELHDWVGGRADLQARLIRTIGRPEDRFAEDHLRMLRAVRLAAQLDFRIEPATLEAIRHHARLLERISAERIRDELEKLFAPRCAARGLRLLQEAGLLEVILPEVAALIGCEQPPDHHPEGTVWEHVLRMLEAMPPEADRLLPWAVLLHDVGKPVTAQRDPATCRIRFFGSEKAGGEIARSLLERLRFPRKEIETLAFVVRHHMQFKDVPQMRKATLRRLLLRPTFPLELELHRLDCLGSHGKLDIYDLLVQERQALEAQPRLRPPLLRGDDLIALGIPPGPAMGRLLAELRDRQLAEELTTREAALAWVQDRWRDLCSRGIEQAARENPPKAAPSRSRESTKPPPGNTPPASSRAGSDR
ncbi:MAG: CCA tRNA nucleotidyltransferase [Limisphaera sp.]|nr:CCA tRNA nucleotidyltransferase [Limisphaera sp.]